MPLRALVFDFDGLILDTEWPEFASVGAIWAEHGHELDLEWWRTIVGTATYVDWLERLEALVGRDLDHGEIRARRRQHHHALIAEQDALPGVVDLVEAAATAGIPIGIASSSPTSWLETHLDRLGLRHRFDVLVGRDRVEHAKPAPDLYLLACRELGVEPWEAVALEDSPHGATAAKAAGLRCVVVPNRITAAGPFDHADLVVASLADLTLGELESLLG
ncbi:MAG TPA: HAD-IA family hydrolase [Acidimicrobiales bacterium]|nr:HAD-IA family hydrolase [Acidimicrobiales bacterium]